MIQALKLDTGFKEAWFYLGDAYLNGERPDEAAKILEQVAKDNPGNVRAHLDLGKAYEKLNRSTDAVRALETALKVDPNRADAHYLLGRLYQKLHRVADAEREIRLSRSHRRQKLEQEESLLKAAGARGDATQVLELAPSR